MSYHIAPFASKANNSEKDDRLFKNGLLRWQAITPSEQFAAVVISLIPVWWLISWSYSPLLLILGVFAYRLWRYKELGLSRPSLPVVALFCLTLYATVLYKLKVPDGGPAGLVGPMQFWGAIGLWLWYIQSHRIRIRLQVVAWACSVVALEALGFWLVNHFILGEPVFDPARTLVATFIGKGESFDGGKSGSVGNYLVPYEPDTKGVGGLIRYTFFFPHPTASSFMFGFILLIALDLKNRLWSRSLVTICSFLILVCQSRNAWVTLPIAVLIHWLVTTGKTRGLAFLLALFALVSFITLSIPSVTNTLTTKVANTAEATTSYRKESTDARNKIYMRTLEAVLGEPPLIGYVVPGAEVVPGYEFARIGTESFILGTLLYKSGLLGTALFLTFFIPFLSWLYTTRRDRPICCFLMLLWLGIASMVTEFLTTEIFVLVICAAIYHPQRKPRHA